MTLQVNEHSDAVTKMAEQWDIIDALMGGTPSMRAAGQSLLPRWPNEDHEHYNCRLKVATLFPAFQRTAGVMAGKPFSKALTLSQDTPQEIQKWSENIDKEGVNLHTFAAEMFLTTLAWGMAGILVETPKPLTPANGIAATQAEQLAAGVRPYFVRIKPRQMLGWRLQTTNGARQLVQLRLLESAEVADGDFGSKCVERVRVLTPGAFEVFEKQQQSDNKTVWVSIEQGSTGIDFIPFVPTYGLRTDFMCGAPPLMNLAYQNVKHWQSQSDQDTILHVARVPILFAKCFPDDATITVGSSAAVVSNSKDADLKFVEHGGKSIDAGEKALEKTEEQMIQSGAELLVAKPGSRSATEDANDAEGNKCDLQRSAEDFEDALDLALSYMARYASLKSSGNVTLFKDYAAATLSDATAQLIVTMQQAGLITRKTAVREQQRRGILSSDLDPEVEIALAAEEVVTAGTAQDATAVV